VLVDELPQEVKNTERHTMVTNDTDFMSEFFRFERKTINATNAAKGRLTTDVRRLSDAATAVITENKKTGKGFFLKKKKRLTGRTL
jgi:hypothetical protein